MQGTAARAKLCSGFLQAAREDVENLLMILLGQIKDLLTSIPETFNGNIKAFTSETPVELYVCEGSIRNIRTRVEKMLHIIVKTHSSLGSCPWL